jgi:nucleoside-diphosphate-sugar epimerase
MTNSKGTLLVTGASGFLGSRVVCLARAAGWHVRVLRRNPQAQAEEIDVCVGDITDKVLLRKACEGVSAVVHAAGLAHVFGRRAKDAAVFDAVNAAGTGNVVEAALALDVPHVVLASSVSVYGSYAGTKCDETASCHPYGAYAISKWRGELGAIERMTGRRGSLTILRFATIYGEGDRGNMAKLIGALDHGGVVLPGSGENKKSLIYKDDAARACLCALGRTETGTEIFNVSAQPTTMKEVISAICQALGRTVPRLQIPLFLLKPVITLSCRMGDRWQLSRQMRKFVHDDVYDGAKFENAFHFCPAISLTDGIRREVEFLRSRR